jgi:hypothetical protein
MKTKIPERKISGASAADDKATEQEGYNILYKAEIDMYTKRKHELEDNRNKTYSLDIPATLQQDYTRQDPCIS